MSILNGNISSAVIYPEVPGYGKSAEVINNFPEPSVTVCASGEENLICCGENLTVLKIKENGDYEVLSSVKLPGKARQIAVSDGFVYITARENGIFVYDIHEISSPEFVYNIDSTELATGIAVSGNILAVTNRHMGCELFDISDPKAPERIGCFLCGEAQSVCLYDRFAVIGDWMNKRARIFDISDCGNIKECSKFYVDGFADGVCTFELYGRTVCAVATGHHSARYKNRRKHDNYSYVTSEMLSEGYGGGHGVEFFDITDAYMPEWLSSIKAPPLFGGLDTWLVYTDGENVVFTDSMNGVFVISAKDIMSPYVSAHFRLPVLPSQTLVPPSVQIQTGAVTGAASVKGFLCTASEQHGVHILKCDTGVGPFIARELSVSPEKKNSDNQKNVFYRSKEQIHSFVRYGDRFYCACGNGGIAVLDECGNPIYTYATEGICHDICLCGDRLLTAEGTRGIVLYGIKDNNLSELSRAYDNRITVRQIVARDNGFAAKGGRSNVLFFDISGNGIVITKDCRIPGILYHRHLSRTSLGDSVIANPLAIGPTVISEKVGDNNFTVPFDTQFCPFSEGACAYSGKLTVIHRNRYYCLTSPFQKPEEASGLKIEGAILDGQPFVQGSTMITLNRYNGLIEIFDISDPQNPVFTRRIKTDLQPEFCAVYGDDIYIACGFGGIIRFGRESGTSGDAVKGE